MQAKTEVKQQNGADLELHYSGPSFEYKKVIEYGLTEDKDRFTDFIYNRQYNKVSLVGLDKDKYNEEVNPDIDVFVVRERNGRQADNHSIGGITKTNRGVYYDYIHSPILKIRKGSGEPQNNLYQTYKENISLKELGYRSRGRATKQHGLCSNGLKQGRTATTMKDGKSHTIDLSQELKKERTGDLIDGRQIQKTLVEIKQYSLTTKRYVESCLLWEYMEVKRRTVA